MLQKWFDGQGPGGEPRRSVVQDLTEHETGIPGVALSRQHLASNDRPFDRATCLECLENRVDLLRRGGCKVAKAGRAKSQGQPKIRLRVAGEDRQRATEAVNRFLVSPDAQQAGASRLERIHPVLATIESMRLGEILFPFELSKGFFDVVLRKPDQRQQPVKAERGVTFTTTDLAVLHCGSLPQHGFGFPQVAEKSGGYPFVLFTVMTIVQFFVVLRWYPETRGITLEDMQKKLGIA